MYPNFEFILRPIDRLHASYRNHTPYQRIVLVEYPPSMTTTGSFGPFIKQEITPPLLLPPTWRPFSFADFSINIPFATVPLDLIGGMTTTSLDGRVLIASFKEPL